MGEFSLEKPASRDVVLHRTQQSYGSALGVQKNFGTRWLPFHLRSLSGFSYMNFSVVVDQLVQSVSGSNGVSVPVPPSPQRSVLPEAMKRPCVDKYIGLVDTHGEEEIENLSVINTQRGKHRER